VELGGTDQTFNLLVGRDLLKEFGHEPQVVLTMPLLEGLDGVQKMSKSLGNHVGIQDAPGDMFGKLMSLPDGLIVKYLTLLTDVDTARLDQLDKDLKAKRLNPRDAKADMAVEIVSLYHGPEAAKAAREEFANVFSRRQAPSHLKKISVRSEFNVVDLLVEAKLVKSKNEARNLLRQNALDINGSPISTPLVSMPAPTAVLRVGSSRFVELEVVKP
jgi:tyrosyl-tRNA synthetase